MSAHPHMLAPEIQIELPSHVVWGVDLFTLDRGEHSAGAVAGLAPEKHLDPFGHR